MIANLPGGLEKALLKQLAEDAPSLRALSCDLQERTRKLNSMRANLERWEFQLSKVYSRLEELLCTNSGSVRNALNTALAEEAKALCGGCSIEEVAAARYSLARALREAWLKGRFRGGEDGASLGSLNAFELEFIKPLDPGAFLVGSQLLTAKAEFLNSLAFVEGQVAMGPLSIDSGTGHFFQVKLTARFIKSTVIEIMSLKEDRRRRRVNVVLGIPNPGGQSWNQSQRLALVRGAMIAFEDPDLIRLRQALELFKLGENTRRGRYDLVGEREKLLLGCRLVQETTTASQDSLVISEGLKLHNNGTCLQVCPPLIVKNTALSRLFVELCAVAETILLDKTEAHSTRVRMANEEEWPHLVLELGNKLSCGANELTAAQRSTIDQSLEQAAADGAITLIEAPNELNSHFLKESQRILVSVDHEGKSVYKTQLGFQKRTLDLTIETSLNGPQMPVRTCIEWPGFCISGTGVVATRASYSARKPHRLLSMLRRQDPNSGLLLWLDERETAALKAGRAGELIHGDPNSWVALVMPKVEALLNKPGRKNCLLNSLVSAFSPKEQLPIALVLGEEGPLKDLSDVPNPVELCNLPNCSIPIEYARIDEKCMPSIYLNLGDGLSENTKGVTVYQDVIPDKLQSQLPARDRMAYRQARALRHHERIEALIEASRSNPDLVEAAQALGFLTSGSASERVLGVQVKAGGGARIDEEPSLRFTASGKSFESGGKVLIVPNEDWKYLIDDLSALCKQVGLLNMLEILAEGENIAKGIERVLRDIFDLHGERWSTSTHKRNIEDTLRRNEFRIRTVLKRSIFPLKVQLSEPEMKTLSRPRFRGRLMGSRGKVTIKRLAFEDEIERGQAIVDLGDSDVQTWLGTLPEAEKEKVTPLWKTYLNRLRDAWGDKDKVEEDFVLAVLETLRVNRQSLDFTYRTELKTLAETRGIGIYETGDPVPEQFRKHEWVTPVFEKRTVGKAHSGSIIEAGAPMIIKARGELVEPFHPVRVKVSRGFAPRWALELCRQNARLADALLPTLAALPDPFSQTAMVKEALRHFDNEIALRTNGSAGSAWSTQQYESFRVKFTKFARAIHKDYALLPEEPIKFFPPPKQFDTDSLVCLAYDGLVLLERCNFGSENLAITNIAGVELVDGLGYVCRIAGNFTRNPHLESLARELKKLDRAIRESENASLRADVIRVEHLLKSLPAPYLPREKDWNYIKSLPKKARGVAGRKVRERVKEFVDAAKGPSYIPLPV